MVKTSILLRRKAAGRSLLQPTACQDRYGRRATTTSRRIARFTTARDLGGALRVPRSGTDAAHRDACSGDLRPPAAPHLHERALSLGQEELAGGSGSRARLVTSGSIPGLVPPSAVLPHSRPAPRPSGGGSTTDPQKPREQPHGWGDQGSRPAIVFPLTDSALRKVADPGAGPFPAGAVDDAGYAPAAPMTTSAMA